MSKNFLKLKNKVLRNRIVLAPMCQYSSLDGNPSNWHHVHYGKLMHSGVGMLMIESTAVSFSGRISLRDLVLNQKRQILKYKKFVNFLKSQNDIPIGIQLSHAGRKGSSEIPWIKKNSPLKNKAWETYAPSAIKRSESWPTPKVLTVKEIQKIKKEFIDSVSKAEKAGFNCVEIHMAHGYLLHQFLSPISNKRKDIYGGSEKNRFKLPLEIIKEIKIKFKKLIIGCRVTGSDRLKDGIDIKESIRFIKELEKLKVEYVCVSSGGILPITNLKIKKGFNVDLSSKIKKKTKIKVRVAGKITDMKYIKKLIKEKKTDLVALGRILIAEPNIILNKNKKLIPSQYNRSF